MATLHTDAPPPVIQLGRTGFPVQVLELKECQPLTTGTIVCGGRISVPNGSTGTIATGGWHRLECDDGRTARVVIVEETEQGFVFTGKFL